VTTSLALEIAGGASSTFEVDGQHFAVAGLGSDNDPSREDRVHVSPLWLS
jgi:hypothetical protein